jgi:hypothetical protein
VSTVSTPARTSASSVEVTYRRSGLVAIVVDEFDAGARWTAAAFVSHLVAWHLAATLRTLVRLAGLDQTTDGHPIWCEAAPEHQLPGDTTHTLHVGGDVEHRGQILWAGLHQDPGRYGGRPYVAFGADGRFGDAGAHLDLTAAAALADQLAAAPWAQIRPVRRIGVSS